MAAMLVERIQLPQRFRKNKNSFYSSRHRFGCSFCIIYLLRLRFVRSTVYIIWLIRVRRKEIEKNVSITEFQQLQLQKTKWYNYICNYVLYIRSVNSCLQDSSLRWSKCNFCYVDLQIYAIRLILTVCVDGRRVHNKTHNKFTLHITICVYDNCVYINADVVYNKIGYCR